MLDLNFKNSSVASLNLRSVVFTLLKAWQGRTSNVNDYHEGYYFCFNSYIFKANICVE